MVTLEEILKKVEFHEVWEKIIDYYPDMTQMKEKYNSVFNELLTKCSVENTEEMIIHIDEQETDHPDEEVTEYHVHGKNNSTEWTGYWDISPSKWEEWLGFYVHDKAYASPVGSRTSAIHIR